VVGDGVMALFGRRSRTRDHALRACRAALRIQELVHRLAGESDTLGADDRHPGAVGLNSGEVVFHHIETEQHIDYSATGHAVHFAARMSSSPSPDRS
jgi:adenylate cyclase